MCIFYFFDKIDISSNKDVLHRYIRIWGVDNFANAASIH